MNIDQVISKIDRVIDSCDCITQLLAAHNYCQALARKYTKSIAVSDYIDVKLNSKRF